MKAVVDLWIPCNPPRATWQSSLSILGLGKRRFIGLPDSSPAAKAKRYLISLLASKAPDSPLEGVVWLDVQWVYPYLTSHRKAEKLVDLTPCGKRPDGDNLLKLLCDVLTDTGYWQDDSQAFDQRIRRYYGRVHGIGIKIGFA